VDIKDCGLLVSHPFRVAVLGNVNLIALGNDTLEETEHLKDLGVDSIILKGIAVGWGARARTGFIWHRIATRGRLL
jgi:hypothetical protein